MPNRRLSHRSQANWGWLTCKQCRRICTYAFRFTHAACCVAPKPAGNAVPQSRVASAVRPSDTKKHRAKSRAFRLYLWVFALVRITVVAQFIISIIDCGIGLGVV